MVMRSSSKLNHHMRPENKKKKRDHDTGNAAGRSWWLHRKCTCRGVWGHRFNPDRGRSVISLMRGRKVRCLFRCRMGGDPLRVEMQTTSPVRLLYTDRPSNSLEVRHLVATLIHLTLYLSTANVLPAYRVDQCYALSKRPTSAHQRCYRGRQMTILISINRKKVGVLFFFR